MLPTSTLTFADLYGQTPPGHRRGDTVERDSTKASGDLPGGLDTAQPAVYWIALVGLLVAIRLLWQFGGKK